MRRISPQKVAGRNGDILLIDKSFPNVEQSYEVYLSAESLGLPLVAHSVAEWLMGPVGYSTLRDSYDTSTFRTAYLSRGFEIENSLNKFGRCKISFSCKPQRYLDSGDSFVGVYTPSGSITNPTQFDAQPVLRMTTTGSSIVTVNGKAIYILEAVSNFDIDCETMEATDNSKIRCEEFPVLKYGANSITCSNANVPYLLIKPRWWTL